MSLRPMLWSVPSVDPIREIIGCNDRAWLEVVNTALREQDEAREAAEALAVDTEVAA